MKMGNMVKQALQEWLAEGEKRFGKNFEDWKFVCPVCGRVSSGKEFKELGCELNDMYQMCIGRVNGKGMRGFNSNTMSNEDGCDWSAFGLFGTLGRGRIVSHDGKDTEVFDFAEGDKKDDKG